MKRMLVMHGPNLNLTGVREPGVYGTETLEDINRRIAAHAEKRGYACDFFQSNHEGELLDRLHAARGAYDGVAFNAGDYTFTSIALRDAIAAAFRWWRSTSPTSTRARSFGTIRCSRPSAREAFTGLAGKATCWRSTRWRQ